MVNKSVSDKEKALLEKIEKAKKELIKLQEKQKMEIGHLAYKFQLHEIPTKTLESEFKEIAEKHHVSS